PVRTIARPPCIAPCPGMAALKFLILLRSLAAGRSRWRSALLGTPALLVAVSAAPTASAGPLFAAPFLSFDTGTSPAAIVWRDVNGDGKPDLLVADEAAGSISVLPGIGDGTFGSRTDFACGTDPVAIAAGDLNGDGK